MNTKVIVKVMNFHSLLRVDAARREAEKLLRLESEVEKMICMIQLNRNFMLDKRTILPDESMPILNIYIGSDYGFCGGINSQVNIVLTENQSTNKIMVGKKLRKNQPNVLLCITRDEFETRYKEIEKIVSDSVLNKSHSKISLIYNHFYNTTHIELREKCVYPFTFTQNAHESTEDFLVEGDIDRLLENLMRSYLNYEIKIAAVNSFASENIMRQNATSESLKKIEEKEQEEQMKTRKQRNEKEFRKVIDSYMKKKGISKA